MRTPVILVCAATAALYFFIPFINAELLELFAREDQLVEWTGALAYLGASTMALLAFVASAGQPNRFFGLATKRNFFMLLLAVLFFFAFGEEISWGQRIFGWVTPREYGKLNLQGETNLHNLWLFHVTVWDGNLKSSLQHLLHTNRLISMFWMAYCVLIPVGVMLFTPVRSIAATVGFPVPALLGSAVFLSNYAASKVATSMFSLEPLRERAVIEYREAAYALGFLVLTILLWRSFAARQGTAGFEASPSRIGTPVGA